MDLAPPLGPRLQRTGSNGRAMAASFGASRRLLCALTLRDDREGEMTAKRNWSPPWIPHSSISRALLVGSLAVVSVDCYAPIGVTSTAGITYMSAAHDNGMQNYNNTYLKAVLGSGQRDLKCEQISATALSSDQWVAEGCGQRAIYACPGDGFKCQMILISKLAQ